MASAPYNDISIKLKVTSNTEGAKKAVSDLKQVENQADSTAKALEKTERIQSKTGRVLDTTESSAGRIARKTSVVGSVAQKSAESAWDEVASDGSRMSVSPALDSLFESFQRLGEVGVPSQLADFFKSVGMYANQAVGAVGNFVREVGERAKSKVEKFTGGITNLLGAFKRIALYRFIRTVIKEITEGFKEGIDNLYQWSAVVNGQFKKSMDMIATSSLYMKNSLGAMVAPLINAIAPAIDYLIDKFVALLNVINQVLALFTGATTWTKAKKYPTQYADAVSSGAGKATEALHKLGLAQIDELTILDKNHGDTGSGGGGGSGLNYGDMFETQKLGGGIWDKIKEAIDQGDWRGAGKILAERLNEIVDSLDTYSWGKKLGTWLNNGIEFAYGFMKFTDFKNIGKKIAEFINGGLGAINFETLGRLMTRKLTALYDTIIGFLLNLDWGLIGRSISDYILGTFREWNEWLGSIDWYKMGVELRQKFDEMVGNVDWDSVGQEVLAFFKNAVDAAVKLGVGIILPISDVKFDPGDTKAEKLIEKLKNCLNSVSFGLIGWMLGGPGGAVLGAVIGLGIEFALKTDLVDKADKYGERINQTVGKHIAKTQSDVDKFGQDVQNSTNKAMGGISSTVGSGLIKTNTDVNLKTNTMEHTLAQSWNSIKQTASTSWSGIVSTIGQWIEKAKQKLNFSWKLPEVQLPHIPTPHFSLATGIMGVQFPHFDGWWANGGFPEKGSLFIANEAGAEMVGSMGGRTAVANNDQIVEGIRAGVYDAVTAAMANGGQSVNVYLDGKQISGTVVNNINSETRRTGSSPLLSY